MSKNYTLMVLFFVFQTTFALNKKPSYSPILLPPTATIAVNTPNVCQNAGSPIITFMGSGGTAPYTFTYTVTGTPGNQTIPTTSGNSVTLAVPTNVSGTFTYTLVGVTDSTGAQQNPNPSGSVSVNVSTAPTIDFTFNNVPACSGTNIQFTSSVSGSGTASYSWDFGDGTALSTQQNPTHSFNALGCGTQNFTVTLTVIKNGCTIVKTHTIMVMQKPDFDFTDSNNPADPFSNCSGALINPIFTVTLDNTNLPASPCITSYTVDWGDSTPDVTNATFPLSHTYSQLGVYNLTVTALGTNGCSHIKTYQIKNISSPGGGLSVPISAQNACAPTPNIDFTITNWGTNSLDTTYSINYGDNSAPIVINQTQLVTSPYYNTSNPSASAGFPIPHSFAETSCPGYYTITLIIANACIINPPQTATIYVIRKPTANFSSPEKACDGSNVLFTNTTLAGNGNNCSNASTLYTWNFGDPASGTSNIITTSYVNNTPNASHIFSGPGTYTVTLTAQNIACGQSVMAHQICIEPPLTPSFTILTNPNTNCAPLSVTTTNTTNTTNSCPTPSYLWQVSHAPSNCGIAISPIPNQTTPNATYNFTEAGTYTITLTATNSCLPSVTTSQVINVIKPPTISTITIGNPPFCLSTTNPTVLISPILNANNGCGTLSYAWSASPNNGVTITNGGTATPTFAFTQVGTYTITATITNDCGSATLTTNTFTIQQAPNVQNETTAICSGTAFSVTPSETTIGNIIPNGTNYSWSVLSTVPSGSVTGASSGSGTIIGQTLTNTTQNPATVTYTVIPSFSGCNGTSFTVTVTVNPGPTITSQPQSSEVCVGGTAIQLEAGTNPPANGYQWFSMPGNVPVGVVNSPTFDPPTNSVGTISYYCQMTFSSGGCPSINSNTVTVVVQPQPVINPQPQATQTVCVGGNAQELEADYTGGIPGATFEWFNGTGNSLAPPSTVRPSTFTPLATIVGTDYYYCIITFPGLTGCTTLTSANAEVIIVNPPNIDSQPIVSQSVCQGQTPTNLTVIMPLGGNYTYQWYRTPNTLIPLAESSTYTPLVTSVGTANYYCVVTDTVSGCEVTSSTSEVIVTPSPVANALTSNFSVCVGGTIPQLTAGYTNGSGTPIYEWFSMPGMISVGNTASFTPLSNLAGTYNYYCQISFPAITGNCSVITTNQVEVIVNPTPVIANETLTVCSGIPFSVPPFTASGNIIPANTTYTWSNPTIVPAGNVTGTTNGSGEIAITQTLTNTTTSPATVTYVVTPTSHYINPVLDCIGADFTITVTVNPAVNPTITVNDNDCFGSNDASIVITTPINGGIPPFSILWTGPNVNGQTGTSITNLVPGNYSVVISDSGNCDFTDNFTITEPTDIVITTDNETDILCYGENTGSIAISVSGGTGLYTYEWIKDNNPIPVFATSEDIQNLFPGQYEVTVYDSNGCGPKTAAFTITEPPELIVSLISQTNVLCHGDPTGSVTVSVSGGNTLPDPYTYSWSGPNFTSSDQNLMNLYAGTYTLTVTDNNDCEKQLTVVITESPQINVNYSITPITCDGANDGAIIINTSDITGGIPGYTFAWDNFASGLSQSNLGPGNYTIEITDSVGCNESFTITIAPPPAFNINPTVTQITCFGANNGSINLNPNVATPPVTLTWSDGNTSGAIRNNLAPGTYTATLNDGTSCPPITQSFTIVQPLPLQVSATVTHALDCNNTNSGSIILLPTGGTLPLTYSWSNGSTQANQLNIPPGTYTVIINDSNNCGPVTAQYTVTRPAPLSLSYVTDLDVDCTARTVVRNFTAQAAGGIPPYTYSWSGGVVSGSNNQFMTIDQNGQVFLSAIDALGCPVSAVPIDVTGIFTIGDEEIFSAVSIGSTYYGGHAVHDPIQFQSNITGNFTSVLWDFGDGQTSTEVNPTHAYNHTGTYPVNLMVYYDYGFTCTYPTNTIEVIVTDGYVFVVPNTFTPATIDNYNDTYRPVTKSLKNIEMNIYDTLGGVIYTEKADNLIGWNGTINGYPAENGNYNCIICAETFYGTKICEKKTFTLKK